jgi:hypothetical protein
MPRQGLLRIHGHGDVEVERVTSYLSDLRFAYDAILIFETTIEGLLRDFREFPEPWYQARFFGGRQFIPRRGMQQVRSWPPSSEEIAPLVPVSEQLLLSSVKLASPGFWEFLGKLNPLEVVRQYLNDRHERRKDKEYRESAEKRRLLLENLSLENKVIAERLKLAKEFGATDRDLAPLLNGLVFKPLTALDRHQDHNVIEHAELSEDNHEKKP